MWNNSNSNSGYFPPPPLPPRGASFQFPNPDPYGMPGSAPPPPPPLPSRPLVGDDLPERMPSPSGTYATRGFHHHHQQNSPSNNGGYPPVNGGFAPPSGPPPPLAPRPGGAGFSPPGGPPPGPPSYAPPQSSYPGAPWGGNEGPSPNSGYNTGYNGNGWAPPSNGYPAPTANYTPPMGPSPGGSNSPFPYQPPGPPRPPPSQTQYYGPSIGTPGGGQQQPAYQYSQCNGKKKALIIGINYIGTDQELAGCINDARRMRDFIIKHFNYRKDDIVMLTDDARRPEEQPTRANILRAMEWLVRYASANDSLFFHYSGHGGLTKDLDGDEEDGWDEVIYPVDYRKTDHIVDDQMHDIMVKPLPTGCRLTAVFDSCHSGSALDLPFVYSTEGKIKEPNLVAEAGSSILDAGKSYLRHDYAGVFRGVKGLVGIASGGQAKTEEFARRTKSSPADVISWSGCKDSQTSADTQVNGQGTGAMSWAFMASLNRNPQQSYQQLLVSIRSLLRDKYSQRPQLSSSHPMDTSILFIA